MRRWRKKRGGVVMLVKKEREDVVQGCYSRFISEVPKSVYV